MKEQNEKSETIFAFYKCDNKDCNKRYAVEEEATEEPICPCCGGCYFEHIVDRSLKI